MLYNNICVSKAPNHRSEKLREHLAGQTQKKIPRNIISKMHKIKEKGNLGELKENGIIILSMQPKFDNYSRFSILNFASKKQVISLRC